MPIALPIRLAGQFCRQ